MLFLLFGSSASGKTSALGAIRGRVARLAIHDFDEIGVPADADTAWRHRADEQWVQRALEYQDAGIDLLLAAQTPLGELLATPSAGRVEAVSGCLLDCDDRTRRARLHERGPAWLARVPGELQDHLNWAEWMRRHARDPSWRLDVIQHPATAAEMRWSDFGAGDPHWRVRVIDTTSSPPADVAAALIAWIDAERARLRG